MWGNWAEKAKAFAENIDAQLNESVGAETPSTSKQNSFAPSITGIAENTHNNEDVWNDDDFAFGDDDDNQDAGAKQPAAEVPVPVPAPVVLPAEPQPPAVAEEQPFTSGDDGGNVWAEDLDMQDVAVDGEQQPPSPTAAATEETPVESNDEQQPKTPPTSAMMVSKLGGAFGLGSLSAKVHLPTNLAGKVHLPANLAGKIHLPTSAVQAAGQINFMSPLSSIMSSLSHEAHDDDNNETTAAQQEEQPKETEQPEHVTPLINQQQVPAEKEEQPQQQPTAETNEDHSDLAGAGAGEWTYEYDLDLDDKQGKEPEDQQEVPPTTFKLSEEEDEIEPPPREESTDAGRSTPLVEEESTSETPEQPNAQEEQPETTVPDAEVTVSEEHKAEEWAAPNVQPQSTEPEATPPPEPTTPSEIFVTTADDNNGQALEEIKKLLEQREQQLAAKADQMFQLQLMFEQEKQDLVKKIHDTKEEAKKRIQKAKERCEAVEARLQASTSALSEDAAQQAQLVATLRTEGESLARKQAEMEKTVRAARGEARELKEQLEYETSAKEQAMEKIAMLESDLKTSKEDLAAARRGESQAGKLDADLQAAKEEISLKANAILSLEQSVKELKNENKELSEQVEAARQAAELQTEKQSKLMRKEHNTVISDLEAKLQTSEREAAVREDALRHEVEELRKRWQDAVRRADALSMDVQSSTAPLLRQLESMERQYRARASTAAELETKLRAELEETVIQNEKLTKDYSELKIKFGRQERHTKEQEHELQEYRKNMEEQIVKIAQLEEKLKTIQFEAEKKKEEYAEVERLANEGVSKVRSEMSQAVLESEERYRTQLDTLKEELRIEKDKRTQLEDQVDDLLENAAVMVPTPSNEFIRDSKQVGLREYSEGQADILESALFGLGGQDDNDHNDAPVGEDKVVPRLSHQTSTGSFAALETLTSSLKNAKIELESLRKRLQESERVRENLLEELGESREAKEKLPFFEAKVKELMQDNREKELEIQGLQDDIAEVKEMYRTQLNLLLEEKAAAFAVQAEAEKRESKQNGSSSIDAPESDQPVDSDESAGEAVQIEVENS